MKILICYNFQRNNTELDVEECLLSLAHLSPTREDGFRIVTVGLEAAKEIRHQIGGSWEHSSPDGRGLRQSSTPTFLKVDGISVPIPSTVTVNGKRHSTVANSPFAEEFHYLSGE
jgi:hypothetical protein